MSNPLGGIKRGWEKIKSVYERIFGSAANVNVEFYDYTVYEAATAFFAVGRERGVFHRGDTAVYLAIRTTRVFQLRNGKWKQVHHHGSIDDPKLLAKYQESVKSLNNEK